VAGLSICKKDVVEWLTDDRWIVLCFYSGFSHHLEQCYFTPGTPKNAEFEIMAAPVALALRGMYGVAPFCRIKDTQENRELLRAAIAEFHDKRLLPAQQLSANIQELRQKIRENIIPGLR
jgi:predicted Rdx family selenoprotein